MKWYILFASLIIGCGANVPYYSFLDTEEDSLTDSYDTETETVEGTSEEETEDTNKGTVEETNSLDSSSETESESEWKPPVPVWTDPNTNLTWTVDSIQYMSVALGRKLCKNIGMRLPTFEEAESIIVPCYEADYFPYDVCCNEKLKILECFEATSTVAVVEDTDISGPLTYKVIAFFDGIHTRELKENDLGICARCVRE